MLVDQSAVKDRINKKHEGPEGVRCIMVLLIL